jgi:hypothetical protein
MKSLLTILCAAIILSCVIGIGCSDNKSTNSGPTMPAELVGTWWYTSASIDGNPVATFAQVSFTDTSETGAVTLAANDTWSTKELYNNQIVYTRSGNIRVKGDSLTVTVLIENGSPASADDTSSSHWSVSGNVLTLTSAVYLLNDTIPTEIVYTKE